MIKQGFAELRALEIILCREHNIQDIATIATVRRWLRENDGSVAETPTADDVRRALVGLGVKPNDER